MNTLTGCVLLFASKSAAVASQIREALDDDKIPYEYTINIQKATEFIASRRPCLVVVDSPLDDAHLTELFRKLKKMKEENPFEVYFLLDSHTDTGSQWDWFSKGADEFGFRDTSVNLIVQRIRCILRPHRRELSIIPQKGFFIDRDRYQVFVNGTDINLPRKEFELLLLLVSRPDKVFTRDEIFRQVWGSRLIVGDRTIDVHIRKIREKIGEEYIVTVKGVGYKFTGN